jgi:hypothetical protein
VSGPQGFEGATGVSGPSGGFGGVTESFVYSSSQDATGLSSGEVRVLADRVVLFASVDFQVHLNALKATYGNVKGYARLLGPQGSRMVTVTDTLVTGATGIMMVTVLENEGFFAQGESLTLTVAMGGTRGAQGVSGPSGVSGPVGVGVSGPGGVSGDPGVSGPAGVSGPEGVGVSGPYGARGVSGPYGAPGVSGPAGMSGTRRCGGT